MWTTIALSSALLLPAQNGGLEITNQRLVYGMFGAERKDNHLLPGDALWLRFDIQGLKVSSSGGMVYSMELEIRDSKNKLIFRQEPRQMEWRNALGGGSRLPAFAQAQAGIQQAPGEYALTVTVTDLARGANKAKATVKQKFEITDKDFGLVQQYVSVDAAGQVPVAWMGVRGQSLFLNYYATGFKTKAGRAGEQGVDVDLHAEMRILDESGKPTLEKPMTGDIKHLDQPTALLPMLFRVDLSRAGKFTAEVTVKDNAGNKKSTLKFPITVVDLEQ